ncbi:MAG: hypothetical protein ACPHAT_02375 [Candidatus Poseidoniaceae archaeon]
MVGDDGKFFIKQFGLQRSGTNAVKALLEVNFPEIRVLTTYLGNKHKPTDYQTLVEQSDDSNFQEYDLTSKDVSEIKELVASKNLPIIFQIKKPIPWFDSYFRYQKKKILFRNPEANPKFNFSWISKSLEIWIKSVTSWLELSKKYPNSIIIEHMEILTNPDNVVQRIMSKFSYEKTKTIELIENEMKRGHYKEHGKDLINPYHKFDPTFHTEKKWLENYAPELLEFAQKSVDETIAKNPILSEFDFDFSKY